MESSVGYPSRPTRRLRLPSKNLPSWIRLVSHLPFVGGSKKGRKNGDLFVGQSTRPYYAAAAGSLVAPIFGDVDESGKRVLNGSITVDLKGRKMFGLGPAEAAKGNSICVLHGCSVPVILKQEQNY
jgi:hypothetical protein